MRMSSPDSRVRDLWRRFAGVPARHLAALLAALACGVAAAGDWRAHDIVLGPHVKGLRWADRNGDGQLELFVIESERVRYVRNEGHRFVPEPDDVLVLPATPAIVDVGPVPGEKGDVARVYLFTPRGVLVDDSPGADAGSERGSASEEPGASRTAGSVAGFRRLLRVRGIPPVLQSTLVDAVRDFSGDGTVDLVVPTVGGFEVFLGADDSYERTLRLRTNTRVDLETGGASFLRPLRTGLRLPRIDMRDFDGDGATDLAARSQKVTEYFLQREGSFDSQPSFTLDRSRWESDSQDDARSDSPLGRLGVIIDERDVDGDGKIDFLVTGERRIRLFFGKDNGVDFSRPDILLKVSDDLLAVVGMDFDEDDRTDLVAVKFELPGVSRLLAALFISMRFDLEILGYRNVGERKFARRPTRRNRLTFELPPLLDVLDQVSELTGRFLEASAQSARLGFGDLDGDGQGDAVYLREQPGETHRLELYLARDPGEAWKDDGELGPILFDPDRREWTLESLIDFLANLSHAAARQGLRERAADVTIDVPAGYDLESLRIDVRDLDGDGAGEIVARWNDETLKVFTRRK